MGIHLGISSFIIYCSHVDVRSILLKQTLAYLTTSEPGPVRQRWQSNLESNVQFHQAVLLWLWITEVQPVQVCDVDIKVCSESSHILAINTSTETIDNNY